ncbi:MAG: 3-dehydroquinate synthase [Chitinophagales bacterium]|nr:MAG: 3-dehydroquinate synthase [Chitinophagales bacterium]
MCGLETIKTKHTTIYLSDTLKDLSRLIRPYREIVLLCDENTRALCLPALLHDVPKLRSALILEIPSGEAYKNIETCSQLWSTALQENISREALWINVGGGVICDLGGFTAATYKRGIRFINIPTTLLAQIDATVGGKLGVDHNHVKNAIGLFQEPALVFINPVFLKTLPDAEVYSGFAEMLKHALIASEIQWNALKKTNPLRIGKHLHLIRESLLIKKNIVTKDPLERNLRKVLNFGHTLGHALESAALSAGRPLRHGHAVALGMLMEAYLSNKKMGMPKAQLHQVQNTILKHFCDYFSEDLKEMNWKAWITHDKKAAAGSLNFTLLHSIGNPVINVNCAMTLVEEAVDVVWQLI